MLVPTLSIYCEEIAKAKSTIYLSAIRAQLQGMYKDHSISLGIYQGLNKDIRDRADWLRMRGNK